ncbi:MAG: tetratricopeptide repeat protein [Bacteroidia bacterium]
MEEGALLSKPVFNFTFKVKCIILLTLGMLFYADSIMNEYALDDGIVITKNEFVQDGFGGIKNILTHDAYWSYYHQMNANQMLAGGRYRPLSIIVFAIEHSFFGEDPTFRHAISILAYLICIFVVFYFLDHHLLTNMQKGPDIAFLAAILFTIHPMHTEVVANVKSLDEMLSLIFILLTFIFALRYADAEEGEKKRKDMFLGVLFFFLALLAKEYALMLIFLLPLLFYTVAKKEPKDVVINTLPYLGVFALYFILRYQSVGLPRNVPSDEILNNPYMLATHPQKIASEIYVLGKYLFMLFVPYPLSSDYSYAQLPYRNFADPLVWLCIAIYGFIIYKGIQLALKQRILAFPIFFYLANLAMVSNFIIDIGATMGERLAFHSSLGFVVVLSYGIIRSPSFNGKNKVIMAGSIVLIILCGIECINRNLQWENDITLFTHDVDVVPNSVMVNGNAGARYLDLAEQIKDTSKAGKALVQEDIDKSIRFLRKSIAMHPTYTNSYLNMGIAFYKLEIPDSSKKYWDIAKRLYPDHPNLKQYFPLLAHSYLNQAMAFGRQNKAPEAIIALKKGLFADNTNPDLWYNIGGAYFTIKQWDSARYAWNVALQLKPDYALAKQGLSALPPPTPGVVIKGIK